MANQLNNWFTQIELALKHSASTEKAASAQRFFPSPINCFGANAKDIQEAVKGFFETNKKINADQVLELSKLILSRSDINEMRLSAFALIEKFVSKHYDDSLLHTFQYWLENYTDNWAQVDDLCLKTIYKFLMARPHLIASTKSWAHSNSPWCRRASNVVWVKFIHRKIKKQVYQLDPSLIVENCLLLIDDKDEYVQKSIGWLLKVTAVHHPDLVESFLYEHYQELDRSTLRYAIEKMPAEKRKAILAFPKANR